MKKVIFHVGANSGQPFLDDCLNSQELEVYAFEPDPEICSKIRKQTMSCDRYNFFGSAVGIKKGKTKFYLRRSNTCNGIAPIVKDNIKLIKEKKRRSKLNIRKTISVEVVRLDSIIEQYGVKKIDYLFIDTEGNDLNVLKSLGKYISIVQAGIMEVARSHKHILYVGQPTIDEAKKFLKDNGFSVVNSNPHGPCLVDMSFLNCS